MILVTAWFMSTHVFRGNQDRQVQLLTSVRGEVRWPQSSCALLWTVLKVRSTAGSTQLVWWLGTSNSRASEIARVLSGRSTRKHECRGVACVPGRSARHRPQWCPGLGRQCCCACLLWPRCPREPDTSHLGFSQHLLAWLDAYGVGVSLKYHAYFIIKSLFDPI